MTAGARAFAALPRTLVVGAIRFYQRFISPAFPPVCRFSPTCSSYALTSVQRFGVLLGGWMALKRIARCHPFNPGGYDPVPERAGHNNDD